MNDKTNDNKIYPLISNKYFYEKFYGMEIFCPIDEDSNMFQRIKIIDHLHFQVGDTVLEYDDTIDPLLFKNLERFTSENFIFNPKYYIEGERYINYDTGSVARLKKFTPTKLIFTNDYISNIHELYRVDRSYGHNIDRVCVWLGLGKNRIDDVVVNKQVISKEKLTEGFRYSAPSIIIHDLKNGIITSPRDVSPDRTKIKLQYNDEWIDIHDEKYKYYQIKKTKSKLHLKEINIDDLKSDYNKSFDADVLGNAGMIVFRTTADNTYFVSRNGVDAEKMHAETDENRGEYISADDVSAVYIVDDSVIYDILSIAKLLTMGYI